MGCISQLMASSKSVRVTRTIFFVREPEMATMMKLHIRMIIHVSSKHKQSKLYDFIHIFVDFVDDSSNFIHINTMNIWFLNFCNFFFSPKKSRPIKFVTKFHSGGMVSSILFELHS